MTAAAWSKRLALASAGVLVAVGLNASSAAVAAGEGRRARRGDPAHDGGSRDAHDHSCRERRERHVSGEVDAQEYQVPDEDCIHHFESGTTVKLTAEPKTGHSFIGWSDFKCISKSASCTMQLAPGTRYVAARFSPVTLKIFDGKFGRVTVTPQPSRTCSFDYSSPCEYKSGTVVTLRREHAAACIFAGSAPAWATAPASLDAAACKLPLLSSEVVGAGYATTGEIPPVKGSGIEIKLAGKGKGKVTGRVANGGKTLTCDGAVCRITGLTRYDYVNLRARAVGAQRLGQVE